MSLTASFISKLPITSTVKQEAPNPPSSQQPTAPTPTPSMASGVPMPVRIQNKFVQPRPTFVSAMNFSNQMTPLQIQQQQMKQQQMRQIKQHLQQQQQHQQQQMTQQPPRPPSLNVKTPTAEDLKISIKQSLVPTQSPARPKLYNQMNQNMVRFVANNAFSQYIQNRKSAQNILADALHQTTSNTTNTNSVDRQKSNEESSDDSFVYGSRNGQIKSERNQNNTNSNQNNNNNTNSSTKPIAGKAVHAPNSMKPMVPQKRIFSSISNPPSTRVLSHGQYPQMSNYSRYAVNAALAAASGSNPTANLTTNSAIANGPNGPKKKLNVNVWCWKSADVVEWLLSTDIGKLYLVNFARSDINGLKLTLLTEDSLKQLGVNVLEHRKFLLQRIAQLIKQQNEHNQHIPFRCLYCNVYSPSRVVILQHIHSKHGVQLPVNLGDTDGTISNHNGSKNGSPHNSDHGMRSSDVQHPAENDKQPPEIKVHPKMTRDTSMRYAQYWNEKSGRWQCSRCNSSFAQRTTLRSHLSKKHSIHIPRLRHGRPNKDKPNGRGNVEDRRCQFCNKIYSTRYYCERHRETCKQRMGRSIHDVQHQNDHDVDADTDMDGHGETRESSTFSTSFSDSRSIDSGTEEEDDDMNEMSSVPATDTVPQTQQKKEDVAEQKFECTQCGQQCDSGLDLLCHVAEHESQ